MRLRNSTPASGKKVSSAYHPAITGVVSPTLPRLAGIRCIVCMSSLVPRNKIDAIKALGAEVQIIGKSQDEAQIAVDENDQV